MKLGGLQNKTGVSKLGGSIGNSLVCL